jgi:DNA-binding SARP family transcriptional activator/tetratricopeptide (TPR) repeat protein
MAPDKRAPNASQTLSHHRDPRALLTLFLLGDLRLERDGAALLAGRRKPLALLAFLARRRPRSSSREELATLLWGSVDDANARKSLRQSLSDLRTVDGLSFVETDAGIALTPGSLATDVDSFEADLRTSAWLQAIDRWHGDFLAFADSLGGVEWQHWVDGERTALRRQLALACDRATANAEQAGEWRRSLDTAAKWRTLLPDDSRAWCREINALQSSGRIPDAVARLAEGEQHFRRELGAVVPDDLARLSRVLSRVRDVAGTPAASLLTPDLVGRAGLMDALSRARVGVRLGEGRTVLILAPEGLGKTRLVREFARLSRETDRKALVVEAAANPSDKSRAFSFLQGIIGGLATHDALAGCAPETLATLAVVAPTIRAHFRHLPSSGMSDPQGAIRSALAEVARESAIILVLDDLPDADDESQSVIATILLSPVAGVLVVATGRPESWHASRSLSAVPSRLNRGEQYALEPLTVAETRGMLSSMAPLAPAAIGDLTTMLHRQSGGNPGLIASSMTQLVISRVLTPADNGTWSLGGGEMMTDGIAPAVEERWRARCGEMTSEVRAVVDAAAILCVAPLSETGVRELEELVRLEAEPFRKALEHLLLCGVLRVHDGRVSFSAELVSRLAYAGQAPSARSAKHARAARLLRRISDAGAREAAAVHRKHSGQVGRSWQRVAALVVVAALGAVAWYGTRWNAARVPPRTPVLLADVVNLTGDSAFDQTLYFAASVGLQQSRQISLFPRSRVRETLALMQRAGADSVLDEALAREVAVRENLRSVVLLSVARVDQTYLVGGRIVDPSSGADLYTHQERVRDRNEVLDALDKVLTRLRRGVGESRDSIRAFSAPLPRVTTGSLPALKSYATALRAFNARRYNDARAAYRRAVELDSSFALAWLGLAELQWQTASDREAAYAALARAERHADRLTERERLRLAQTSAGYRGHDTEELRIAEVLARSFPELTTWYNVGNMLMHRRRCPEAITSFENALGFDSSFVAALINVATCHQFLGASEAAVAAYHRAWAVDSLSVYQGGFNHEFGVALVRAGRLDSALAVYQRMARRPVGLDQQYGHRSLAYHGAWTGRWRVAEAEFDSAARLSRAHGFSLSEFRNRILQAELLWTAQQPARARQTLDAAWGLRDKTPIAPAFAMYAGLAFVRSGQLDRAAGMLRTINASMREASSDDRTVRAILTARIALAQNRAAAARRELEAAVDTTRSDYILPALVDILLALGHRDSALVAATQFESRAVFGVDAQDAWLRNLLIKGRIAEQLGRTEVATTAYARLESQLMAGDADHPLLVESRRGLARLAITDAQRPVPPGL